MTTPVFIPGGLVHSESLREAVGQFFDEGWYSRDARNAAVRPQHFRNGFFTDHTLFTPSDLQKSEYYEKFARKADVPWFAAGRLSGELTGGAIAISLQRSAKEGAFTLDELARLNSLLPHLSSTMQLALRLVELKGRSMIDGLQLMQQPAILLNPNTSIASMNQAAEALLGDRLSVRRQRLVTSDAIENSRLQSLIEQACSAHQLLLAGGSMFKPVVLAETMQERRLIITAAPINRSAADVLAHTGAILMLSDLKPGVEIPPEALQRVFDLTRREAEIMSLIGKGRTLPQIGTTLGIAVETVRHHLKTLFTKTDTRRQSDLAILCFGLRTFE